MIEHNRTISQGVIIIKRDRFKIRMSETTSNRAIICVDDEAIILMHMEMILKKRYGNEYIYKCASSAQNAINIIEKLNADGIRIVVVISDWHMPGMKGDEFIRFIHEKYPEISAIMVSGKIESSSVDKLFEEGCIIGFLSKPIPTQELFTMIDTLIAHTAEK